MSSLLVIVTVVALAWAIDCYVMLRRSRYGANRRASPRRRADDRHIDRWQHIKRVVYDVTDRR